jgi:hypothetical protein
MKESRQKQKGGGSENEDFSSCIYHIYSTIPVPWVGVQVGPIGTASRGERWLIDSQCSLRWDFSIGRLACNAVE